MTLYHGSCHCGAVRFEAETEIRSVLSCNCSICHKKGVLHHRVAPGNFRLLAGEDALTSYRFGTGKAQHLFCRTCGIHAFSHPRAAPDLFTLNVRTLDDYDIETGAPDVIRFDGRNWEEAVKSL